MNQAKKNNLCWLRRDLRLTDHRALYEATEAGQKTYLLFIFDPNIISNLPRHDRRITFIIESLKDIELKLLKLGSSLLIRFGNPKEVLEAVINEFEIGHLFFNHDYEPMAKKRDEFIIKYFAKGKIQISHYKDHVFFEKHEVTTDKKEIYKVFTPYKNKWLTKFQSMEEIVPTYHPQTSSIAKFQNPESIFNKDWFNELGFESTENELKGGESEAIKRLLQFEKIISDYHETRDFPALEKTSFLSPYLRMGNISIREVLRSAVRHKNLGAQVFLSELIWRDFYQVILDVFPKTQHACFKAEYNQLQYRNDPQHFEQWKTGMTGYPIIDASMRCLNATGLMHNRLRMVVASFLTKTLLIDWRWGESYFALHLLDYDMAANLGGWQWSASTGVDAQPYFRIFNPYNQSEKFDSEGEFIKMWCPELRHFDKKNIHFPHEADIFIQAQAQCRIGIDYPHPIVAYKEQKELALSMFKAIKP